MLRLSVLFGFCRDCPLSLSSFQDNCPWKNSFLLRLSVIFGFCRDCYLLLPSKTTVHEKIASCWDYLSYLASAETVLYLLLPSKTTVHEKITSCWDWLRDTASCLHSQQEQLLRIMQTCRRQNHTDSLGRKLFLMYSSLGRKQETADSFSWCQDLVWQHSQQEMKTGGLVYTLCKLEAVVIPTKSMRKCILCHV